MAAGIQVPLVVVDIPATEWGTASPSCLHSSLSRSCGKQFGSRLGNGLSIGGW